MRHASPRFASTNVTRPRVLARSPPRVLVTVSSPVIKTLEERGWVEVIGHREAPGRPALFATTKAFLDALGLRSLEELPVLEAATNVAPEFELQFAEATRNASPAPIHPAAPDDAEASSMQPAAADAELSADPASSPTDSARLPPPDVL